jgi:serine/threonine protein kinase
MLPGVPLGANFVTVEPDRASAGDLQVAARAEDGEREVRRRLEPEFLILRRLGGGRLSTVYLAREPALQRLVAVKALHPPAARHPRSLARFLREARSLARVSHPNVVSIYRVGDMVSASPYLVMQYVKGRSLAQRIAEEHRASGRAAGEHPVRRGCRTCVAG